jgi:hypothetical protein
MGHLNSGSRCRGGSQEEKVQAMSLLINSIYYFIECVFILSLPDCYRLVVLHNGRVLTDVCYETLRGAKIAFSKLYHHKAWAKGVKAQWSHFYRPDADWLDEKIKDSNPSARPIQEI